MYRNLGLEIILLGSSWLSCKIVLFNLDEIRFGRNRNKYYVKTKKLPYYGWPQSNPSRMWQNWVARLEGCFQSGDQKLFPLFGLLKVALFHYSYILAVVEWKCQPESQNSVPQKLYKYKHGKAQYMRPIFVRIKSTDTSI